MPSLKHFHIFFILSSIALTLWFGVWGVGEHTALAVMSFVASALLVVYLCKVTAKI